MAMTFAAMPMFWRGMLLMYALALKLGWLPSYGSDTWKHLILPTLSLGMPHAARQMRFTRSSMLEAIREDYVRTARAKGCKERAVIWKHAVKNALLPVVTVLGNSFGAMIGGTVVIEKLFSIPGIGTYMVNGITNRDVPVVTGSVVMLAICYSLVTMLVDVAYGFIDPRTRARFTKRGGAIKWKKPQTSQAR
jgi:peptide/nickel transport system permease protein